MKIIIFPNITTTSLTYPGWDMYCYMLKLVGVYLQHLRFTTLSLLCFLHFLGLNVSYDARISFVRLLCLHRT
jgi:hypothetical protein